MNNAGPGYRVARRALAATALALAGLSFAQPALAADAVKVDPLVGSQLPVPGAHWVWVNDVVFHHMGDGKAFLVDGESGRMLGMLSTGSNFVGTWLPRDRSLIYSPEIYFSRGTRGTRTDVISIYDGRTLNPVAEIGIPAKRVSALPMPTLAGLSDDDRFMYVYNFTPAQSVSVVDLKSRKFAGEIDTAGCALAMPTGPRTFFALCGDGTGLGVTLDESGKQAAKARSAVLFDPKKDPVMETGVREGSTWRFLSYAGDVVPVETAGGVPKPGARWSLLDAADRKASWRPGGLQSLAVHAATRRLYALMHVGGVDTHKEPGSEVWVYDLATQKRVQRIKLAGPAMSIAVSSAPKPLLFAIFLGAQKVEVYDPAAAKLVRTINEIGFTPSTLTPY